MTPQKPSLKDLAVIVGSKPLELVPALLEASREVKLAQEAINNNQRQLLDERAHKKTMAVFQRVDLKQTELEIYEKALKETVIENEVVGQTKDVDGKIIDIVKRKTVNSRNINHLVRQNGRDEIAEIIRLLLVNVNNYFNVKDGLNGYQIIEIAEQIIDECGDKLFIDELVYIFKKAKTQTTKDNSIYNHIDGSIIFGWIDNHIAHKFHQREKRSAEHKAENYDIPNLPQGLLKQAAERMTDNYRQNVINMTDVIPEIGGKKKKKKD